MDRIKDLTPTDPDLAPDEGDAWRIRYRPKDANGSPANVTAMTLHHKYGTGNNAVVVSSDISAFISSTNDDGPYLYIDKQLGPGYNYFTLEVSGGLTETLQFRVKAIPKAAQPTN